MFYRLFIVKYTNRDSRLSSDETFEICELVYQEDTNISDKPKLQRSLSY